MATATAIRTGKKSNARKISPGDHWSRNSYGTIVSVRPDGVIIKNDKGDQWQIDMPIFEAEFNTADQFNKTEKVSRTEMVQKIIGSSRIVMTINFRKQAVPKDLKTAVQLLLNDVARGTPIPKDRALGKLLKEATVGTERIMIGRHFGTTDEFGRIHFLDVESTTPGLKTVDPRTVEWCIIDCVRYEIK